MQELSRVSLLIGEENIEKLNQKCILILGLGGVGGYVAEALARSGIGNLILVDSDSIDITNINRQIIALHSTLGKAKVEVWKSRIEDILPTCKVTAIKRDMTEENISSIFETKIDYVIDACDTVATKLALIQYCLDHQIPFITCLGTGKRMDPSQLQVTDLMKTEQDPLAKIIRKKIKEKGIKQKIPVLYSKEPPKKVDGPRIASSIFVPSSAGILIASYVFRKLLEDKS